MAESSVAFHNAVGKLPALVILAELFAICRFLPETPLPPWVLKAHFYSVTKTKDELSIVIPQDKVAQDIQAERNYRAVKVKGPLAFEMTGILASLALPLANAGISIFSVSTYDTDYVLIKSEQFSAGRGIPLISRIKKIVF